ncbi:hypothetical protein ABN034_10250 [Actinopolymorpha sp. B11F2]|uniref:hypothetical protein n=1 Tax=Actinopolymorpha sp. B11F2 TaxID=3160862 RepID=UPI0032E3D3EB
MRGSFDRFQAKGNLMALSLALNDPDAGPAEIAAEMAEIVSGIHADHIRHGISYAGHRVLFGVDLDTPRNRAVLDTVWTRTTTVMPDQLNAWPSR